MARSLKESERQLWDAVTQEIRPLKGRAPPPKPAPEAPPPTPEPAPAPVAAPAANARKPRPRTVAITQMVEVGRRQPGLDDTSWRHLSNGRLRAERTLDLHGRTAQAAFIALHGFLLRAQADRLRCVEIITGVGSGQEGGILRRELPFWLSRQDLRHLVLAAVHPHPGNPGSVRVLLRRRVSKGCPA
ncbi:Smr/MutS family protein [Lichenicoccus sp.]|uniref:Smr/MutS family protein n=1 Tax=Lichenicoccus sp. TaxID=2781899 RepID=UPI003D14ABE1